MSNVTRPHGALLQYGMHQDTGKNQHPSIMYRMGLSPTGSRNKSCSRLAGVMSKPLRL